MRACAATWPPKTRWRCSSGLTPRKMFTSMGSMSRSLTRKSSASLTTPSWQASPLRCRCADRPTSPKGSCGAPPPPLIRSREATPTTTGGPSSTPRGRRASSPAVTRVIPGGAGPRTSTWWRRSDWGPTGSRWSGAGSSPPRGSGRAPRSTTTAASAPGATSSACRRWSPSTTSPSPVGCRSAAVGRLPTRRNGSPGCARRWPSDSATSSAGPAR